MWEQEGGTGEQPCKPPSCSQALVTRCGSAQSHWAPQTWQLPFVLQCKPSSSSRYFHSKSCSDRRRSNPKQYRAERMSVVHEGRESWPKATGWAAGESCPQLLLSCFLSVLNENNNKSRHPLNCIRWFCANQALRCRAGVPAAGRNRRHAEGYREQLRKNPDSYDRNYAVPKNKGKTREEASILKR